MQNWLPKRRIQGRIQTQMQGGIQDRSQGQGRQQRSQRAATYSRLAIAGRNYTRAENTRLVAADERGGCLECMPFTLSGKVRLEEAVVVGERATGAELRSR